VEKLEYIELPLYGKHGNGKVTIVDGDYDGEYFSGFRWILDRKDGYAVTKTEGRRIYLHHLVCAVTEEKPWRDHIDRNKLNNRSCNLRPVTPKENAANRERTLSHLSDEERAERRKAQDYAAWVKNKNSKEYHERKRLYDREYYKKNIERKRENARRRKSYMSGL